MEESVAGRLKLFIDTSGISVSEFADMCGIGRPTLSHILTGRNKKISDVMVGQIHRAFPDLSVLWLLFGEGPVKVSNIGVMSPRHGVSAEENDLKKGTALGTPEIKPWLYSTDTSDESFTTDDNVNYRAQNLEMHPEYGEGVINDNLRRLNSPKNDDKYSDSQIFTSDLKIKDLEGQIEQMRKNPRKVLQITIYYDDSTFETFFPK